MIERVFGSVVPVRRCPQDAARASKQPISINHTGCRALTDLPRNKTDEELRLVAEKGGFVGIYFMPFLAASSQDTGLVPMISVTR